MEALEQTADNNRLIAWTITYEILRRSKEDLRLTMLHPGGGQYDCLTLLRSIKEGPLVMINITGTSIKVTNSDELIRPYCKQFCQNPERLLMLICEKSGIKLAGKPYRSIPVHGFFLDLVRHEMDVTTVWIDSSYSNGLSREAENFAHYLNIDENDYEEHLPWWLIRYAGRNTAICNIDKGELIMVSGRRYNILNGESQAAINDLTMRGEWANTINTTKELLNKYDEWRKRYDEYADIILSNTTAIKEARAGFRQWEPLKFYLNLTNVKNVGKKVRFDVRFLGQAVAEITWSKDSVKLSTKRYETKNDHYFGCVIVLDEVDWDSVGARNFRKHFKACGIKMNKGNEEHRIESMILSEMLKKKDKMLRNMAPVTIGGLRFPMPTPLKGSDHKTVSYARHHGGGIDVFARVGTGGYNTNLCIMELKDENTNQEPPKDVIKQALVYTTFIQTLLRSESGEKWWKLFGFNGTIPDRLVLYAACVMPSEDKYNKLFGNHKIHLNLDNNDVVALHHLYFKESGNSIASIETSLKF